jgi:hypothetical protein
MPTGVVLLCFDGSEGAVEAIRCAGSLLPGHDAVVLSVATPAKDELPLDPVSDVVGRFSGRYRDWDESAASSPLNQACTPGRGPPSASPRR